MEPKNDALMTLGTNVVVWTGLGVFALVVFLAVLARFYHRASKELAFVRTGLGGEKVILDGGALKWPVFHEIIPVNMRTLRLQVDRKNEEGLITADRMRVDVTAEFYVRVKPVQESIAKAAQTLGNRTLEPERLKELLQGKFVDALRSVAAGMSMEQLHERRVDFVQSVQQSVNEDLLKNGLELESVSLTALDQTARQFFKEDNAFDAQGLAKLTQITEAKREERNRIEQETRVLIETKNLETEKQSLEIKRDGEFARLMQQREVDVARAQQEAEIAKEQALRRREAEQARIIAEQQVRESTIASDRSVRQNEIEAARRVEEAQIVSEQAVEMNRQDAAIAVAKKSEAKSKAEAEAAVARSELVKEEEQVVTVKETAAANRFKEIQLIKAREDAEKKAIEVTVRAEAEKQAAIGHAEARLTEARADAERVRLVAEADQRRLEVEAFGERAINEAKNILSEEIIRFELRKRIAELSPEIIAASVKPMEKIESIKVIQTNGLGGLAGGGNGSAADGSLPNQLVQAALGYRMNLPLVEKLLAEIGLKMESQQGMLDGLTREVDGRAPNSSEAEVLPPGPEE
jgi:uncharacterized membrane protein YqiK